jgi:sulfate permease, SulP family
VPELRWSVMLIPQGMAYAMIAGLPPIHGLYASTIPLIIYGLLGTSRQLAVGPVAMVSLLTAAGVGVMAEANTLTYVILAASLALMVGVIQWGMGMLKLGFVVNFLSHPVVSGFTSAAAIIIGFSQFKHILGIPLEQTHLIYNIILEIFNSFQLINLIPVAVTIVGIAIIVGSKKMHKAIPGSLLAVLLGIPMGLLLTNQGYDLSIVGSIPAGLPSFVMPELSVEVLLVLLPTAIAISMVGFMESMAVASAIQSKHKNYNVVPNQELKALGLANVGTAFFQGFPVTGGFSRTAVNDQAGAKTGMASIIAALLMIMTLLFLTALFYYLPTAILAAVIVVAVSGLINFKLPFQLWKTDRNDFYMLMATFLATLFLGIEEGIIVGVVLSLLVIIYRSTKPHYAVLGKVPGTQLYRNVKRFQNLEMEAETLIIRFDADLYYANLTYFRRILDKEVAKFGPKLRAIIINAESISTVDSSAIHMLEELYKHYNNAGIRIAFSNVKGPVRDAIAKSELLKKLGEDCFHLSTHEAVIAVSCPADETPIAQFKPFTLQTFTKDKKS